MEKTEEAGAETLLSGPNEVCRSPKANIIASRALLRATLAAEVCPTDLNEMLESVSNPTAITVSRIIKLRVTIRANPDCRVLFGLVFMGKWGFFNDFEEILNDHNVITIEIYSIPEIFFQGDQACEILPIDAIATPDASRAENPTPPFRWPQIELAVPPRLWGNWRRRKIVGKCFKIVKKARADVRNSELAKGLLEAVHRRNPRFQVTHEG
ncbi:MAG: hypothetical protein ABIQ96_23740 [Luteolibacter sp.]